MILVIIFISIFVLGFILHMADNGWNRYGAFPAMCMFIGGVIGASLLACWPVFYYDSVSQIEQINSIRQSVQAARDRGVSIKDAAIQLAVIEANAKLASLQYQNSLVLLDDFISDEVEKMEPIR